MFLETCSSAEGCSGINVLAVLQVPFEYISVVGAWMLTFAPETCQTCNILTTLWSRFNLSHASITFCLRFDYVCMRFEYVLIALWIRFGYALVTAWLRAGHVATSKCSHVCSPTRRRHLPEKTLGGEGGGGIDVGHPDFLSILEVWKVRGRALNGICLESKSNVMKVGMK